MSDPVLSVRRLGAILPSPEGPVAALGEISFDLMAGETLALIGESGAGKTLTALSILGLAGDRSTPRASGSALFQGKELLALGDRALGAVRGRGIAMIAQEPLSALDPTLTIGTQLADVLRSNGKTALGRSRRRVVELLRLVGIPWAERCAAAYPHELGGGTRRLVLLACALGCEPAVLIADEPTAGVDSSRKAQIALVLRELQRRHGTAILLLSHDLALVTELAARCVVLFAGRVVESGPTRELFSEPTHPYTRGLLTAAGWLPAGRPGAALPAPSRAEVRSP